MSLRVLMLGWEFPPHISGGLGTACYGITRGLAANGVEVLFVVPRAHGDEMAEHLAGLLGCNRVPIEGIGPDEPAEPETADPEAAKAEASSTDAASRRVVSWEPAEPSASVSSQGGRAVGVIELLAVDSSLRPYESEREYTERRETSDRSTVSRSEVVEALRRLLGSTDAAGAEAVARAADLGLPVSGPAEPVRQRPAKRGSGYLPFSGAYGEDLIAEVGRYALVVGRLAGQQSFDAVHAHDWLTIPAGVVASRVSGKPLVLHVHATEYDRSGEHVNPQVAAIERMGVQAADRIVPVSHFTASILRRRYGADRDRIRVVHNAVTHREQESAWKVQKTFPEPIVLFLGRVTFQKGPDYFLQAAAKVVQIEPRVKFVMSGSGDMLPRMVEHAARLGIARNVHFTGFLRGKDVERMYAMADVYVMPSVSEPFGISPLEAMALDVPVVLSRQSGVSEILANALKCDFWDVNDLANKILAVLRYPALVQHLVEEGRREVTSLRWEQQAKLLVDVYREVIR